MEIYGERIAEGLKGSDLLNTVFDKYCRFLAGKHKKCGFIKTVKLICDYFSENMYIINK